MSPSGVIGDVRGTTRRRAVLTQVLGSSRSVWWLQGVIAAVVIAYGVSTLVVHRPPSGYNTFWDGWVQNIASALPVIPLLLRARRSPKRRSAWLAMAAGVTCYTLADLMYTYHDQNLKPIPFPAPSDAFFLLCNAAFIVGFAVLTQSAFGRVHVSVRLDGAIAGLQLRNGGAAHVRNPDICSIEGQPPGIGSDRKAPYDCAVADLQFANRVAAGVGAADCRAAPV